MRATVRADPPRPVVAIAHHVRTGITALNAVTAALASDARTRDVPIVRARSAGETVAAARAAHGAGRHALVLVSYYSTDAARTEREVARMRSELADTPATFVVGGVHATAEPEPALRAGFDLAVVGEGESTAIELVAALAAGADPRGLRGTCHLADGALVSNGRGPRRPLDDFPSFDLRGGPWNAIEITRGCIYACSFCQTPFAFGARFRHRSVASVREHVRAMRASEGFRYVRFLSPTALSYGSQDESVRIDAVGALLAAVREEAGAGAKVYFGTFPSELRPEHVTPEALAVIARWCDNRTLIVGGQSGSDRVLAAMHRGHDVAAVERAVRVAVACGFQPDVDLLLGLPGESAEERRASLALAGRLVALGARIHSHAFLPLPGTPLAGKRPEPIEADARKALAALASRGRAYGQWRAQVGLAGELTHGT